MAPNIELFSPSIKVKEIGRNKNKIVELTKLNSTIRCLVEKINWVSKRTSLEAPQIRCEEKWAPKVQSSLTLYEHVVEWLVQAIDVPFWINRQKFCRIRLYSLEH